MFSRTVDVTTPASSSLSPPSPSSSPHRATSEAHSRKSPSPSPSPSTSPSPSPLPYPSLHPHPSANTGERAAGPSHPSAIEIAHHHSTWISAVGDDNTPSSRLFALAGAKAGAREPCTQIQVELVSPARCRSRRKIPRLMTASLRRWCSGVRVELGGSSTESGSMPSSATIRSAQQSNLGGAGRNGPLPPLF